MWRATCEPLLTAPSRYGTTNAASSDAATTGAVIVGDLLDSAPTAVTSKPPRSPPTPATPGLELPMSGSHQLGRSIIRLRSERQVHQLDGLQRHVLTRLHDSFPPRGRAPAPGVNGPASDLHR